MKKLLLIPFFALSSSLAFAASCETKECDKDKKDGKSDAIVETATFAGSCSSCGGCSGDKKKDKKETKDETDKSGYTVSTDRCSQRAAGVVADAAAIKRKTKKRNHKAIFLFHS